MFTDGCTDGGQTTDGRQAHRHIPRDFRSGKKRKQETGLVLSVQCCLYDKLMKSEAD